MKKVLLVGEAMQLLIANDYNELEDVESFTKKIAGAELNVAVGLTRLGYEVEYMTKLGNDPFGKSILKFIKKENIKTNYIDILEEEKTGMMLKSKVKKGDPKIYYYRKGSAASKISKLDMENVNLNDVDLVHITGISLAISKSLREAIYTLIEKAKKENVFVSFDPNIRVSMWDSKDEMIKVINDVSKKVDLIIPGINEAKLLLEKENVDDIIKEYKSMGINNFVIKDGDKGSYFIKNDETIFEPSFIVEEIVDTVGAGDGFAVGILSSVLENESLSDSLIRANAIGAIQVGHISDNEALPDKEKLNDYIKNTKRKGK